MTLSARRVSLLALAVLLTFGAAASRAQDVEAQPDQEAARAASANDLRRRIEGTWRVVPLQRGLVLVPRRASVRVKGIELGERGISVDGRTVTGAELTERLGADAEPVLQLSYLPMAERAALLTEPEAAPVERPRPSRAIVDSRREPITFTGTGFRHGRSGARVRLFGPLSIAEGEHVGDVVAVFGSIDMRGTARGNVVSVFGNVNLGPKASAAGDVVAIAGRVRSAPGALAGQLTEIRVGWPDIEVTVPGDDQFSMHITPDWARIARVQWLTGAIGSVLVLAICVFTVLLAPRAVSAAARPGRSLIIGGLVGLAIQILLLPALVLIASALTLSVIGIPLLAGIPVLLFAVGLAAIVGFTGLAARLGGLWSPRGEVSASVAAVVIGLGLIWATGLSGRYLLAETAGESGLGLALALGGVAIEYVCWTIGLGSAVMAWKGSRKARAAAAPVVVPPLPPESPAPAAF